MKSLNILLIILFIAHCSMAQQITSANHDSIMDKARHYESQFQFDTALQLYESMLKSDSSNVQILARAGHCSYQSGRLKLSEKYFKEIILHDSVNKRALAQLANIALKRGNHLQAKDIFLKLTTLDSLNSYYYKKLGEIYTKLQQDSLAEKHFLHALSLNRKDMTTIKSLANLQYQMKKFDSALKTIKKGLMLDSSNKKLHRIKLRSQFKLKNYEQAIYCGEKLIHRGDTSTTVLKTTGVSAFRLKLYKRTINYLQQLPEEEKNMTINYYLGICYREVSKFDKSLVSFNQAIEKGIPAIYHRFFIQKGMAFEDIKEFPKAIKTYRRGYQITQKPVLLFHLARMYDYFYKDKEPALNHYEKYVNSSRSNRIYTTYSNQRIEALREHLHFNQSNE